MSEPQGLDNGLTNHGDRDFARYLRRSRARSMGISNEVLSKPIIGIAISPSQFNNCHRYMPHVGYVSLICRSNAFGGLRWTAITRIWWAAALRQAEQVKRVPRLNDVSQTIASAGLRTAPPPTF
jgi:hypothetical protein